MNHWLWKTEEVGYSQFLWSSNDLLREANGGPRKLYGQTSRVLGLLPMLVSGNPEKMALFVKDEKMASKKKKKKKGFDHQMCIQTKYHRFYDRSINYKIIFR